MAISIYMPSVSGIALSIFLISVSLLILVVRCLLCTAACLGLSFELNVIIISRFVGLLRLLSVLTMEQVL
jgi:hypothetical protein